MSSVDATGERGAMDAADAPWHLIACLFKFIRVPEWLSAERTLQPGFTYLPRMFVFNVSVAVARLGEIERAMWASIALSYWSGYVGKRRQRAVRSRK